MINKIWKFFCSAKLTVVLFVLIIIPSIVGTVIQQNAQDPTQYAKIYGPTWNAIFKYLGFYDIYHDPRFIILLVLLGLNTFACTINRFRPKWQMAGMLMTHLGLLLILIGSLTGAIFGEKGFMIIGEGEITDQYQSDRAGTDKAALPFKVKLLDFILERHEEPTHTLAVFNIRTSRQTNHTVAQGESVGITRSRWAGLASLFGLKPSVSGTVKIEKIFHHATAAVTSITEGPEKTGLEAIDFRFVDGGGEEWGHVLSESSAPYVFHKTHTGVMYMSIESSDLVDAEIERAVAFSEPINVVEVSFANENEKKTFSAEVGTRFNVEDVGYSLEVMQYEPDFVILGDGMRTSKSQFPRNPAIRVRMTSPAGSIEQWLFVRFPSMHASIDTPFDLRYIRSEGLMGIDDYLFVVNAPDGEPVLAHIRRGQLVARTVIKPGQPTAVEGRDFSFVVDTFFENANISNEVVDRPDLPPRPSAQILVEQGGQTTSYHAIEGTPLDVPGYRMMYIQEESIRDFYSVLQIVDGEEIIKEKTIEVNDPLRHEGYALYQSSYDSEGLSWSGLQVKKDPGVPLVYGGFLVQIFGMIIIFYINPLVRKAKKSHS